uniref:Ribosome production factor 1 n=1 Tax=Sinocyclocheilus grahami TaxID=75366 RepID=A0A672SFU9_SINGR
MQTLYRIQMMGITKKGKTKKLKQKVKPDETGVQEMDQAEIEVTEKKPESGACFPPTFSVSEIKNKQRRHAMFLKLKEEKRKQKLELKKKKKKERKVLGDQAPPKEVPKTIENQRIYDETTVNPEDEEVAFDEGTDEFSAYFNQLTNPKVLITTSDRPRGRTVRFCEQLATVIPHAHVYYRRGLALKRVIPQCISRGFTYLIVVNEDRKVPNGLILCHLPDGPTAHFKVSSVRLRKEMKVIKLQLNIVNNVQHSMGIITLLKKNHYPPSAILHPTNRIHQIDTIIVYIKTNTIPIITLKSITFLVFWEGFYCFFVFFQQARL